MIDTHVHVWDPAGGPAGVRYPWLTPQYGDLYRAHDLSQIQPAMDRAGVQGVVLVQASDSMNETKALLAAASRSDRAAAVVGWLPLAEPDELSRQLAAFSGHPMFVGVRHLIHDEPDRSWMLRSAVSDGLERLAEIGLTFDAVAETLDLLAQVDVVAKRHEGLTIVIDHLGKPPIGGPTWDRWADLLAAAAAHPNVVAKISGLGPIGAVRGGEHDWMPSVQHAIDIFGPARLMIGSDWPISTVHGNYISMIEATVKIVQTLDTIGPADRSRILIGNAQQIYRPRVPTPADSTRSTGPR